ISFGRALTRANCKNSSLGGSPVILSACSSMVLDPFIDMPVMEWASWVMISSSNAMKSWGCWSFELSSAVTAIGSSMLLGKKIADLGSALLATAVEVLDAISLFLNRQVN